MILGCTMIGAASMGGILYPLARLSCGQSYGLKEIVMGTPAYGLVGAGVGALIGYGLQLITGAP